MITQKETRLRTKKVNTTTFQVEELVRPDTVLDEKPLEEILSGFSNKIEYYSKVKYDLVDNGYHAFIHGMYQAYAEHRPFVLSPDMIWLLVCQGFSQHVNFNQGTAKEVFPKLQEKVPLVVINNNISLGDPSSPWEETTGQFADQITNYVGEELIETLRADFTTTGVAERVASEITIMDAMKPYFEYVVRKCICGIPEITIEGEARDWERIQDKLSVLRKYNLAWWVDKLNPVISEFISACNGEINKDFWIKMFKIHTEEFYGNPKCIDGWILDFYPYDRKGNRVDQKQIFGLQVEEIFEELPKEIACVNFEYQLADDLGNVIDSTPMEYWAGFIGLKQDKESFAIRPEIGWFVSHSDTAINAKSKNEQEMESRTYYNLDSFPEELLLRKGWGELVLNFKNKIAIPDDLPDLSIQMLELNGKITGKEKSKLKSFFLERNTHLTINNEYMQE